MRLPPTLACLLLLGACHPAPPPAAAEAGAIAREAAKHHELQQAIDAVDQRDKAAHAADPVLEADRKREQELKDAGG